MAEDMFDRLSAMIEEFAMEIDKMYGHLHCDDVISPEIHESVTCLMVNVDIARKLIVEGKSGKYREMGIEYYEDRWTEISDENSRILKDIFSRL